MTTSALRGTRTLPVELTNVSPHGFWLLLDEREVFVQFRDFPWFADASIRDLTKIERPQAHHLYWPTLDVDIAVESLEHPERYPLVSRTRPNKRLQQTGPKNGERGRPSRKGVGRARRAARR